LLVTMTEAEDLSNMPALLATRAAHEEITRTVHGLLREQGIEPYVLSTESCEICEHCAYPDAPCRRPEVMYPCVESQGILVSDLAERFGIDFMAAGNLVTWFSLLLYKE
jgi:predicted metal-binding protein